MPTPSVDVTDLAETHARNNFSPSGIVAVARRGEILQHHIWGTDSYDVTTPFRIASCTKSFTALAILMLRRTGLVSLDDEVSRHLPELRVLAEPTWPVLRVRYLLAMSGGLATDNPWGDRQESISREQLSTWAAEGLRLIFPPGTAFEYSNLGYALLGEIISRASGQDYREFVLERIIEPLGLKDTRFAAADLPTVAPGYHREPMLPGQPGGWTPQEPSGPGAFSPIGGLYSSVRDLVAWANLYLSLDVPAGAGFTAADLIEAQEIVALIEVSQAEEPLHGPVAMGYGLGLIIEQFGRYGKVVSHSGGYPGFTSYMCWHASSGVTVIASTNGTHSGAGVLARKVLMRNMAQLPSAGERKEPWAETVSAMRAITDLVRSAAEMPRDELQSRYSALFAENVELDFPLRRRLEHLGAGLANLGRLKDPAQPPVTEQPCRATWTIPAEHGALELFIELMPVAPYLVQTFSAMAVNGSVRVRLF